MNVETLGEWLPWIALAWLGLWALDRVVAHTRWPRGSVECCEHCASTVDLANEGEETRIVLGELLGRLDDVVEVLEHIRDAPELAEAERARELAAGRTFRTSG